MSELFPLPAVLFLCCLLLLLLILAIVYFIVLKKDLCAGYLTGHEAHDIEEGQTLLSHENGEPTKSATEDTKEDAPQDQPAATQGHSASQEGNSDPAVAEPQEEPTPGPSTSGTDQVDGGGETLLNRTPLSTAPPPPSTSHEKEKSPVAETTGESTGEIGFIETEEEPLCRGGKVLVSFTYMPAANKLNMKVIRVVDLPSVEVGGAENIQIHLCVLPMRKQRYRTKQIPVAQSQAVINQTFLFVHMASDSLDTHAIRLRVYGSQRFSKRIIGETRIALSKVDLTSPLADGDIWKTLSPKGMVAKYFGIDEEDEVDEIDDWAD